MNPSESECIFCKIIRGETTTQFLYQDERIVVFKDIKPHAPVHILIVPRKHIRSINDIKEEDKALIGEMISVAKDVAEKQGVSKTGYKLLFNVEKGGGQVIFHIHMHLLGGWVK